jgi:hypothetical protein
MILHFSHIGLTDGRTFMIPFDWIQRSGSGCRFGRRYHPAEGCLQQKTRSAERDQ